MKRLFFIMSMSVSALSAIAAVPENLDTLSTYTLQEVQVTSTRATNSTPVAFKNLSQQQIKSVNYGQDLPYVLSLTPSVTTTSDAGNGIGYTSIRIRGIDPSRINITANGVPVNDAESSQVYWVNMGDFISSAQSVQIQRGAGTSTNGAGAFGGTVNVLTENIGTKPYLGLDLSAGSYYSHKETLRFGTGLFKEHWGLQGRLSNIGSHGYLERAHTNLNSYMLQGGYFGDNTVVKFLTWNGTERTYHAWNYTSKYEQSLYGRRYNSCGVYYDEDGNMHYYDNQTDNYHQQNYQLIWNQNWGRFFTSNVTLHYTKGQGYYDEMKTGANLHRYGLTTLDYYESDLTRQKKMDNDLWGAIMAVNYNNRKNLKATLGAGWNKYDGYHFGLVNWVKNPSDVALTPNFEYYRNEAWKSDFNVYGKVNYEIFKGFSGYVDLQFRHVGYRLEDPVDDYGHNLDKSLWAHDDFDFFNPKFGLNYDWNPFNRVYFSYSISHKEPTRNDYQDNEVQHLKAEKLQDFELGYQFHSSKFSAGVNLYYMLYDHQYVLTGELNEIGEAIASNENSGSSYRAGVELEAAWQPVDWFRWDINATLSRNINKDWTVSVENGTDTEGNTIYTPVNLGNTHTTFSPAQIANNIFTFSYKGFTGKIMSQFVGHQYLTNTDFKGYYSYNEDGTRDYVDMMLHSHFTTNIDLSYTFSLKKIGIKSISAGVTLYNIFSKKYDNNGWAAPNYRMTADGSVEAYTDGDLYEAGFAPSAPFNCMAHLSIEF